MKWRASASRRAGYAGGSCLSINGCPNASPVVRRSKRWTQPRTYTNPPDPVPLAATRRDQGTVFRRGRPPPPKLGFLLHPSKNRLHRLDKSQTARAKPQNPPLYSLLVSSLFRLPVLA